MKCSSCGQEMQSGSVFCQYCGATVVSRTISQQAGGGTSPAGGACVCGRLLSPGEQFCTSCGRPATGLQPTQQPYAPPSVVPGAPNQYPGNPYGAPGAPPYPGSQPIYTQAYLPVVMQPRYPAPYPRRNKIAAGMLAIFLGSLGMHKFYLNQPASGVLYLLFFWTGIPMIVSFIEGLVYLCQSDESFDYQYNYKP